VIFITGCFFFAFQGTYAWGRGVKMGQKKIKQLFFALIEDFGCSFKLNFDGRGGQKW
jgi:hypothetical protein